LPSQVDNAAIYDNEASVGDALRIAEIPRDELYITTKYDGGDVRAEFELSLKKVRGEIEDSIHPSSRTQN